MPDVFCPRQIVFEIPGSPSVVVTATENSGFVDFSISVDQSGGVTADLRGLFFDIVEAKMPGLSVTGDGGLLTELQASAGSVLDLGNGANMKGATKDGFDVGLEWGTEGIGKDDIQSVDFTLSNAAGDLTLDDIAHQRFGARLTSVGPDGGTRPDSLKLMVVAPAAPDANDDSYSIFEDNSSGLDDPSKTPSEFVMAVLENDTDGEGDPIFIKSIHQQPEHGTVSISDDGQSIVYTPELDYAGQVTFEYCIDDGNGGQDSATVSIDLAAVADVPLFDVAIEATDNVNEVLLTVTVDQNDADSSEFLTSLSTSALPVGVTISPTGNDPAGEPDQIVQQFLLTVPLNEDANFDLSFTAAAQETSNGDTQTGTYTVPIVYEFNHFDALGQFTAEDQSIWATGGEYTLEDDRFIGIDTGDFDLSTGGGLYAGVAGHIQLGLQSTLNFEGGSIDASASYDIDVDTNYNKTVDVLRIDISTALAGASFSTEGPEGSYVLDFVYDVLIDAYAGINIDFGEIDLGPLGTIDFGSISEETHFGGPFSAGPGSFNLINLTSEDLHGTIDFPAPLNAFSLNFAWPELTTSATFPPNPLVDDGASNNVLELNLDIDTLVTQLLGVPNVFDPPRIDIGPFFADADLLDVDVTGGLNFLQEFALTMGDLVGLLSFEDGSSQIFDMGVSNLLLAGASAIDAAGDGDGVVEFSLTIGPEAMLNNDTDLGFNVGVDIDLLTVELGYDLGSGISDSITLGPLADFGETFPIGDIGIYDETFAVNFSTDNFAFFA